MLEYLAHLSRERSWTCPWFIWFKAKDKILWMLFRLVKPKT